MKKRGLGIYSLILAILLSQVPAKAMKVDGEERGSPRRESSGHKRSSDLDLPDAKKLKPIGTVNSLEALPKDPFGKVVSYLDFEDQVSLSQASKTTRLLLRNYVKAQGLVKYAFGLYPTQCRKFVSKTYDFYENNPEKLEEYFNNIFYLNCILYRDKKTLNYYFDKPELNPDLSAYTWDKTSSGRQKTLDSLMKGGLELESEGADLSSERKLGNEFFTTRVLRDWAMKGDQSSRSTLLRLWSQKRWIKGESPNTCPCHPGERRSPYHKCQTFPNIDRASKYALEWDLYPIELITAKRYAIDRELFKKECEEALNGFVNSKIQLQSPTKPDVTVDEGDSKEIIAEYTETFNRYIEKATTFIDSVETPYTLEKLKEYYEAARCEHKVLKIDPRYKNAFSRSTLGLEWDQARSLREYFLERCRGKIEPFVVMNFIKDWGQKGDGWARVRYFDNLNYDDGGDAEACKLIKEWQVYPFKALKKIYQTLISQLKSEDEAVEDEVMK